VFLVLIIGLKPIRESEIYLSDKNLQAGGAGVNMVSIDQYS